MTWSSGQELTFPSGKPPVEADFILWYQRTEIFGLDHPTEIVFGEAKSFGREVFQEDDVMRMKYLAEEFPGAVLVFATMKESDELTSDELTRLRKLAEWGREYISGSRHTRAPVILLTGTELFTGYSLDSVWKEKGGKHEQLSSPGYLQLDQLKILADLTQQLYLGMPSYSNWLQAKWAARRERRQKLRSGS